VAISQSFLMRTFVLDASRLRDGRTVQQGRPNLIGQG